MVLEKNPKAIFPSSNYKSSGANRMTPKFCTSIHCMDGRIQKPIIEHILKNYPHIYVDTITEPGPNKILAEGSDKNKIDSILERIFISVNAHGSNTLFVSGHYSCAGNPAEKEAQLDQIKQSISFLKDKYPQLTYVPLWIDEEWTVHEFE
jgi:hypothetical protein